MIGARRLWTWLGFIPVVVIFTVGRTAASGPISRNESRRRDDNSDNGYGVHDSNGLRRSRSPQRQLAWLWNAERVGFIVTFNFTQLFFVTKHSSYSIHAGYLVVNIVYMGSLVCNLDPFLSLQPQVSGTKHNSHLHDQQCTVQNMQVISERLPQVN